MAIKNCACTEFQKITRASGIPIRVKIKFCFLEGPSGPGPSAPPPKAQVWVQLCSPDLPTFECCSTTSIPTNDFNWLLFESLISGCILTCVQEAVETEGYGFAAENLQKGIDAILEHTLAWAESAGEYVIPEIRCVDFL